MSRLDRVALIPRAFAADDRGWLLKVIDGREDNLPDRTGEIYLTLAFPGLVRGNHFHRLTSEWFTIVQGAALLILGDPETAERAEIRLSADNPQTVYIPAGVGHAFVNAADAPEPFLLVAYADHLYDPQDTIFMGLA